MFFKRNEREQQPQKLQHFEEQVSIQQLRNRMLELKIEYLKLRELLAKARETARVDDELDEPPKPPADIRQRNDKNDWY